MTVLIGVCHFGNVSPLWMTSFEAMQKPVKPDGSPDWVTARTIRSNTPMGRTMLVHNLLNDVPEATHLFFVDDDMTFPENALMKLLADDVPIVSGFYIMRDEPFLPVVYRNYQEQYIHLLNFCDGLQEVDAVGAGCLLIKREVFEHMQDPYFTYENPRSHKQTTEDMMFCEVARSLGYKILLDFDVKCYHLAVLPVGYEHFVGVNQRLINDVERPDATVTHTVIPYVPEKPKRRRARKVAA